MSKEFDFSVGKSWSSESVERSWFLYSIGSRFKGLRVEVYVFEGGGFGFPQISLADVRWF